MSAKDIATLIAAEHNLRWSDLAGPCRTNRVYHVRREAMWTLRQIRGADGKPRYSLTFIGRLFNRHHTTVLWACNAYEAATNPAANVSGAPLKMAA